MNQILSQFRRIMSDDGRGDRDFTKQEDRLREAQAYLQRATAELQKAAELLRGELMMHDNPLNLN